MFSRELNTDAVANKYQEAIIQLDMISLTLENTREFATFFKLSPRVKSHRVARKATLFFY